MQLRTWQREALDTITAGAKADYLIEATPGAGKTVFALTLAQQRLAEGAAQRVVVVVGPRGASMAAVPKLRMEL